MLIVILLVCSCMCGYVLFSKILLKNPEYQTKMHSKVSVIIPARNEEDNLPFLLDSLKSQSIEPFEIIVVDDMSTDKTYEIATSYGVKVIKSTELPDKWTGKSWALWNGVKESSGDTLVFLDTDVRLEPKALETLLFTRTVSGGAISVVPYHKTRKFYERLSLIPYLLGVLAFTSPFEQYSKKKGLYGSCIVMTREDYSKIEGHDSVKSEVLDDLNLGKKLTGAGIPVHNFIGFNNVSFRMYPGGIQSELQGFGKGAVLSTANLRPLTIIWIGLWFVGLVAAEFVTPVLMILGNVYATPFLIGYILFTLQIFYFLKYSGEYGRLVPVLHFISTIFFIVIILYSYYQVAIIGSVTWKGRQVKVGRK
ncbi:glycosyltransferase [Anaerocolumna sedimenticola]|uniref:4,4'-diaponeurosporenoate glycosyltransferase n=1 Tax=Anaerocolumna sedimenticola TaxID=2696063 RepID=A0A6P1TRN0_9FIRM|nr:glycosyltransferase family 2 protein [Anaerocolumna sedimenticola]QHQ62902.1 glycosyltransferase [Anaerocolumna sedimenticola]